MALNRARLGVMGLGRSLVLNASFEPLAVVPARRAVVLVLKEKAEILESNGVVFRSEHLEMPAPSVVRLSYFVKVPYRARASLTRRAVFARDLWSCQYCGSERGNLTVDHVIPRSKGGPSTWDNIVTCCAPCNRRKGDRLPQQADMHPRTAPRAPGPGIFIHVAAPKIPKARY